MSEDTAPETSTTYYDRPAIKEPVWTWEVPAYFYVGGVAGAAGVIGAALQLIDGEESEALVRRCRDVAALGGVAGSALLISDLGRPERFLNMLRVFKPSSPLSVGSWILAMASSMSVAAALSSRMSGLLAKRLGDLAGVGAGLAGLPLSGYTAVLVSDTVVPVWRESRKSLPMLFVASSTGAACSLLETGAFTEAELKAVRRLGTIAQVAELVAAKAVEKEAGRVERVARPYNEGVSGTLWKASTSLTVASLTLDTITGKRRGGRVAAALIGTIGSICLRVAVWQAGRASARDPRATFELQRMQEQDHEGRK